MKAFIQTIKLAGRLLVKETLSTGSYGKLHDNHEKNLTRNLVGKKLTRDAEAIAELIFNDKNIYRENDVYEQNKILKAFIDFNHKGSMDKDTYIKLQTSIPHFLKDYKK